MAVDFLVWAVLAGVVLLVILKVVGFLVKKVVIPLVVIWLIIIAYERGWLAQVRDALGL
ncbi:MAG: hypothetical protein ACT4PT_02465 [Methanobacteriota archaeon]